MKALGFTDFPVFHSWEQNAPGPFTPENKSKAFRHSIIFMGAECPRSVGRDRHAKTRNLFSHGSSVFKLRLPATRSPETSRVFCLESIVPRTIWPPSHSGRDKRRMFSSTHLAAAPLAIARKPGKHRKYVVVSMFSSRRIIPRTSSTLHDRETDRSPQRWVHVWSEATARRLVNGRIGHPLIMMSAKCMTSSHLNCSWRYSCAIALDSVRQRCSPARRLLCRSICRALPLAPAMIRREELLASPCRCSAKECFS